MLSLEVYVCMCGAYGTVTVNSVRSLIKALKFYISFVCETLLL